MSAFSEFDKLDRCIDHFNGEDVKRPEANRALRERLIQAGLKHVVDVNYLSEQIKLADEAGEARFRLTCLNKRFDALNQILQVVEDYESALAATPP